MWGHENLLGFDLICLHVCFDNHERKGGLWKSCRNQYFSCIRSTASYSRHSICQQHVLSFLTLYHTILTYNDPKIEAFWKHWGKKRKCWYPAFSPFPTVFSTLSKTNFNYSDTSDLSSANAFNLDRCKNLSFGKEFVSLKICHSKQAPPWWLSDEGVGLMTWWLWVWIPVEATYVERGNLLLDRIQLQENRSHCFDKWIHRWEKCVLCSEKYFKKVWFLDAWDRFSWSCIPSRSKLSCSM